MYNSPAVNSPQPIGAPIIRRQRVYGGVELAEEREGRYLALQALREVMGNVRAQCVRESADSYFEPTIADELLDDGPSYPQPRQLGPWGSRSNANNYSKPGFIR